MICNTNMADSKLDVSVFPLWKIEVLQYEEAFDTFIFPVLLSYSL